MCCCGVYPGEDYHFSHQRARDSHRCEARLLTGMHRAARSRRETRPERERENVSGGFRFALPLSRNFLDRLFADIADTRRTELVSRTLSIKHPDRASAEIRTVGRKRGYINDTVFTFAPTSRASCETARKCFRERLVSVKVRGAYDNEMFLERSVATGLFRSDAKEY